jgi:hypothetical protein
MTLRIGCHNTRPERWRGPAGRHGHRKARHARPPLALAALVCCSAALCGCANKYGNTPLRDDRGTYNTWVIQAMHDSGVRNAIIAQRTLYPYHFVEHSHELNELGVRDLRVLAAHFERHGADLNVRRGSGPDALYNARLESVVRGLEAAGLDPGTIQISDGLPGGDGLAATRVIRVMERAERQPGLSAAPAAATPVSPGGAR